MRYALVQCGNIILEIGVLREFKMSPEGSPPLDVERQTFLIVLSETHTFSFTMPSRLMGRAKTNENVDLVYDSLSLFNMSTPYSIAY